MPWNDQPQPIIIKRKTVASGDGHHGGAWKVAYADFVTAMMAFLLLMWLLNATTEDQRKGLADYFNPTIPISRASAGGAGMLSGVSIHAEERSAGTVEAGVPPKPTHRDPGKRVEDDVASPVQRRPGQHMAQPEAGAPGEDPEATTAPPPAEPEGTAAEREATAATEAADDPDSEASAAERAERERLETIGQKIAEAIRAAEDGTLERHFILHITPEGLVIEIIDTDDRPLFASASAQPAPVLELLAGVLVPVLHQTANDIAVVGHTDAIPFGGDGYSNWELSADRANSARRLLIRSGLPEDRVVRVTGKAAVEPLVPDPNAPQNRRIAVTLLRRPGR